MSEQSKTIELEPEFTEAEAKLLVALSADFSMDTRHQIPRLWEDFWQRNWQFDGEEEQAAYGVSYAVKEDGSFSYAVGRHIQPSPEVLPDGACTVSLVAGRYAVFSRRGPVSEIPQVFDAIFCEWLPKSGEKQREGAVFERYPYDDAASPESMRYQIWLPLEG